MGTARVVLAAGLGWRSALDAALESWTRGSEGGAMRSGTGRPHRVAPTESRSWIDGGGGPIVVLCATAATRESAEHLADRVRAQHGFGPVDVMTPPSAVSGIRGDRWTSVDVSGRGGRFDRVRVPRTVVEASSVALVATIDGRTEGVHPLAIGGLASYAHPRQAILARLDRGRTGVAADLAVAFAPDLIVTVGTVGGYAVAVGTTDLIAAELVGLALVQEQAGDDEAVGPWEDRLVQRATELRLGVRLPGEIDLVAVWAGPADGRGAAAVARLAAGARRRLGIPAP